MDQKKPPDPPDKLFEYTPILTVTLPKDDQIQEIMDVESENRRKRPATSPPVSDNVPPKLPKNIVGRQTYTPLDRPPYIVHVSLKDEQTSGTSLHPVKFGMFLVENNVNNVRLGGIKRLGRNRLSVEFKTYQDANSFLLHPMLPKKNFVASIPQYQITRMGIARNVPSDWSDEDVIKNIMVPDGCGPIIKARRLSRKTSILGITEWKPTQSVVLTFDGQFLPSEVYSFYAILHVDRYMYPTIQCFNCCRFGHTKTICRSKPRCFKCGLDHPGDGCQTLPKDAFCVSCTGNHYANASVCPELGRQKGIKALMAEKSISYAEASQVFPPVSRPYAEVVKSQISKSSTPSPIPITQPSPVKSYRKTVYLKPKPRVPLSPSYDKQAHQALVHDYSFSPSRNGCAFPTEVADSQETSANILNIITNMLQAALTNPTQFLPDHVAYKISTILKFLNRNIQSPDPPAMEREECFSQET